MVEPVAEALHAVEGTGGGEWLVVVGAEADVAETVVNGVMEGLGTMAVEGTT